MQLWHTEKLYYAADNEVARKIEVPIYRCPSRQMIKLAYNAFGDAGDTKMPGAVGDYAGNAGNNRRGGNQFWRPGANGTIITAEMFDQRPGIDAPWKADISLKMITDGLSATFLAGEKHIPVDAGNRQGSLYNGDNQNNCARVAGRVAPLAYGERDLTRCREIDACVRRLPGPCICDTFGSWHPGVCQFVFADGHVASISVSTHSAIVDRMAARDDGLAIGGVF
jgi:prepilin-type processing-associated H-X9-DG protein